LAVGADTKRQLACRRAGHIISIEVNDMTNYRIYGSGFFGEALLESKKVRILIVDDSLQWRKALRLSFSTLPGVEIIDAVPDGAGALQVCSKTRPDVVFVDIDMPGMDGFETASALLEIIPDLLILGVDIDVSSADQQRAREAGFSSIIPKDMILDYLPVNQPFPKSLLSWPVSKKV